MAFGACVAAFHALLALHADASSDEVSAMRQAKREEALARAAPQLHRQVALRQVLFRHSHTPLSTFPLSLSTFVSHPPLCLCACLPLIPPLCCVRACQMVAREEEALEEMKRQAEAEAQRQYEASRAKAEALDRQQWEVSSRNSRSRSRSSSRRRRRRRRCSSSRSSTHSHDPPPPSPPPFFLRHTSCSPLIAPAHTGPSASRGGGVCPFSSRSEGTGGEKGGRSRAACWRARDGRVLGRWEYAGGTAGER